MAKGAAWEREVCLILSRWWSKGKRDDIFWRTSGSGARAKTRSKTNRTTFGQYGDIQATDPIGQPLIDLCTIELKRGYSKSTFADIIDKSNKAKEQLFESFINQAILDNNNSNAHLWILITKRDRRQPLVFISQTFYKHLKSERCNLTKAPYVFLHFEGKDGKNYRVFGTLLTNFLEIVKPFHIKKIIYNMS